MQFFTRHIRESTTVQRQNPVSSIDTDLERVEAAYLCAERAFSQATTAVLRFQREHREAGVLMVIDGKAYVRVNGSSLNPKLQELCGVREDARALRNQLLNQRADLLRRAGKVR
jgi:hypothetical protein